ncbi:Ig-like domain-containing protein [bacterium]|nr:Ig-like domain-containing protein [bacterium]
MKIKRLLTILVLTTYYLLLTTYSVGAQPPEIVSVSPSKGVQEVKTDTLIRITFSKEMDKKSVEDNFAIEPQVKGKFSWQEKTLIFHLERDFIPSTTYTISLGTVVKDAQGRPLAISCFSTIDQLLYIDRENIWIANADGSGRRNLTKKAGNYFGPMWLKGNKKIIFELDSDLWMMNRDGNDKRPLTTGKAVVSHEFLPSPDGKKVAFLSKNGEVRVVDIEKGTEARIFSPENPKKSNLGLGCPFLWSPDSAYLLYNRLSKEKILDIWMASSDGKEEKPLTKNRWESNDWGFKFSSDGKKIAYAIGGALYIMDNEGSDKKKVSGDIELNEDKFSFSPDGRQILFLANYNIWAVDSDGSNLRQLTEGSNSNYPNWLPNGEKIIFTKSDEEKNTNDIWIMDKEGEDQVALTREKIVLEGLEFSSDGRYLAFWTIEGTEYHFWITNIDGTGVQILSSGKERPVEKPNPYLWSLHTD